MEGILKWVEKHPEEAKTTFKDKLKDYFVEIRWEAKIEKVNYELLKIIANKNEKLNYFLMKKYD